MSQQELEAWYIRSLDVPMTDEEKERLLLEMQNFPESARSFAQHKKVRDMMARKKPARPSDPISLRS